MYTHVSNKTLGKIISPMDTIEFKIRNADMNELYAIVSKKLKFPHQYVVTKEDLIEMFRKGVYLNDGR